MLKSPPLLTSVNLGGWFVLEPFISPTLFQKYPTAIDEWTLSTLMAADTASGGLQQIEDHYNTFIVSLPFAMLHLMFLLTYLIIFILDGARYCRDRGGGP
jgi:hypothetical protein